MLFLWAYCGPFHLESTVYIQFLNDLIPHSSALTYREFVVDKFQLPRVYRAHELSRKAYISLQMNQLDAFKSYATEGRTQSGPIRYSLHMRLKAYFLTIWIKNMPYFLIGIAKHQMYWWPNGAWRNVWCHE